MTRIMPSLGSITSRVRGPSHSVSGMPTYVKTGQIGFNTAVQQIPGPAWLGKAYAPFSPSGPARENMNLTTKVTRLEDRRSLLKKLDLVATGNGRQRDYGGNGRPQSAGTGSDSRQGHAGPLI